MKAVEIEDSYNEFRRFLKANSKKVTGLTPGEGIPLFMQFYRDVRAADAQAAEGDGLICRFGMSTEDGPKYEVAMIRTFRIAGQPDSQANRRLRLSFLYPFHETVHKYGFDKLPSYPGANKFCWSPVALPELEAFVTNSAQIQQLLNEPPKQTKLKLEKLWGAF